MKRYLHCALRLSVLAGVCLSVSAVTRGAEKAAAGTVALGVPSTFFKGVPAELAKTLTGPLRKLIEAQTGSPIELVMGDDHEALGNQLAEGKTQLAVMHGFEFAWLREKHPDLKPLVVAVGSPREIKAFLVTKSDGKATCVDDLAGTKLVVPPVWKQHCRLFLERHCKELGKSSEEHFSEKRSADQLEEALDAVAAGRAATVIDEEGLDWYKRRRPTSFAKLKVVAESEVFPATVIVYREGGLSEGAVKRLRDGLLASSRSAGAKELLSMCKIAAFEAVPDGYDKELEAIRKSYPAPAAATAKK